MSNWPRTDKIEISNEHKGFSSQWDVMKDHARQLESENARLRGIIERAIACINAQCPHSELKPISKILNEANQTGDKT